MSKKQDIMNNLVTSLLEITEQGGHSQTVQTCKLQLEDYEQYTKGKYPFIFPVELDKTFSRNGYGTGYYNTLPVRLVCGLYPDSNADNFSAFDNFVRDIKVKLEQNPFRVDYNGSTIRDGLVSWWDMRETSGVRYDAHGVNTLTPSGSVSAAQGVVEGAGSIGAVEFTSANEDELLSVPSNSTLTFYDQTDSKFTMCCFLKLKAFGSEECLLSIWNGGGVNESERSWHWNIDPGASVSTVKFTTREDTTIPGNEETTHGFNLKFDYPSQITLSLETWYFFLCEFDALNNTVSVEVDTVAPTTSLTTPAFNTNIQSTTSPLIVGARKNTATVPGYDFFSNSTLDCVGLWSRLLTSTEKTYLYNSGNGRQYSNFGEQPSPNVSNTRIIRVEPYTNFQKAPIYFTVDLEVDYVHEKGSP